MDLKKSQRGLLALFVAYNLMVAGVWILRAGFTGPVPVMVGMHLGVALLLILVARRIRMHAVCWLLWLAAWVEIGWLYRLTHPAIHDGAIRSLDRMMFGGHPHEFMATLLPWSWLQEVMGAAYLSYYFLIVTPVLVLAFEGRSAALARHAMGLMAVYLACFSIYLVVPVLGPRMAAAAGMDPAPGATGAAAGLMHALFAAGDSPGTAFPSSHCAASLAAALLTRRHFGPWVGRVALAWAGLIILSTIYTSNHYAVDAAAGVALAVGIIGALAKQWNLEEVRS